MPERIESHRFERTERHVPPPREGEGGDPRRSTMYGRRWQKFSQKFLKENPWCVECKKKGKLEPSRETDHVIPHRGDKVLFWKNTFQALCRKCHSAKTMREMRKEKKDA